MSRHGLMAEFGRPEELLGAARRAYAEGYRRMDAYSPHPIDGLAEALGFRGGRIAKVVFLGGAAGALIGYGMQVYFSAIDYPINVGGRPLHSWPAFIVITFELTILAAAAAAVLGMLALNGLPRPHHPVFNAPRFVFASADRFFLCIEAADPRFDPEETRRFLEGLEGVASVSEVEP